MKKLFFYSLLIILLLFSSLWIVSYFMVTPYSTAPNYTFVIDWIKKNLPEDRKDKILIADNYQTSTVQLFAELGDPNPPFIIMTPSADEEVISLQKKYPVDAYIQKHDTSVKYKIYENTKPYIKSIIEDINMQDFDTPLLYSIRNFRELLLTVTSKQTIQPRPRILEFDGFPRYASEKTNIRRSERSGGLSLSKKPVSPEEELVSYKDDMTIYNAGFSKPIDISDIELVFAEESRAATVLAMIEYKSEASKWHLLGERPFLLVIDQSGVGRITIDSDVYKLEQGYNSLYYMKDRLSRIGHLQEDKRHVGLDPRFPSFPDKLCNIKELQITLSPPLREIPDKTPYYFSWDNAGTFLEDIETLFETKRSLGLKKIRFQSSNEYENIGCYTGTIMDLRPHKINNKEDFRITVETKADIPKQTEVQVLLRFSCDSTTWSDWYNIHIGKNHKGTNSVYAEFDYFQYKLVLLTKGVKQTPKIRGMSFFFHIPLQDKLKAEENN